MDVDMEMNITPSPSGGSRNETSPYIMYSQQQQIRHDSSEKVMSEYHVLVPGTCRIPVVLVYSIRGLLYIEEDQNSWICSDPENLRKRNTYVYIPSQFSDYVCTIYVWNQNHPTGREEWINHWRSFPFFTVYIIILVYVLHFNLYYPVLPLRISSLFKTGFG